MKLSQLNLYLDSGVPIVCVNAPSPERINVLEDIYIECSQKRNIPIHVWNAAWGYFKQVEYDSHSKVGFVNLKSKHKNIFSNFDYLLNSEETGIFVFENLSSLVKIDSPKIISQLINIFFELKNSNQLKYLIILSTDDIELPQSLSNLIPSIYYPLPNHEEITNLIEEFLCESPEKLNKEALVSACAGLTKEEIRLGLKIALNSCSQLSYDIFTQHLLEYKINRFRSNNLNFVAKPNIPDFGGLDLLRKYIENVKYDFLPQARTANIPLPKGCLLVGPPGTGKTLSANVIAKILDFPLISVDTALIIADGATYLKRLLERVEACAPVVMYFDEFDKLFAASNNSGEDTSSRQILGALLTWLQDKTSAVFVVATLNRLDALPPELTRVGRFDEIFYVGFPQAIERKEILMMHLSKFDARYRTDDVLTEKEWRIVLNKTVNCSGAELAQMVQKAARAKFHQGCQMEIGLYELLEQREMMVPLYVRDVDRVLAIANRAKYITQPASSPDTSVFAPAITSFWGEAS
ncbi:AAA family ATPase [Rivularia sp. UHCC 0363]|uniref:AAA family ATPase n=1 Tax=Rivularia sp. UHCC 0363 TaxID=3110244 RepID=UPI002B1F035F|nr:AAA family ATPase [Rivularia sp. UHCC 0363]MEA5599030.1 AAA family ATPase [Rivularia sp. UHCC 0363]